jgi:hypothetical protein
LIQAEGRTIHDLNAQTKDPGSGRRGELAAASGRTGTVSRVRGDLQRVSDIQLEGGRAVLAGAIGGAAAVALQVLLGSLLHGDPGNTLLLAAVLLAAWIGGLAGGSAATVVALALDMVLFDWEAADADVGGRIRLVLFAFAAVALVILLVSRRAERDRLARALEEVAALA